MKIAVVGTGYVGLVSGVCFAEIGHHVICIDIDTEKINTLSRGKSTIYEEGLEELLQKNLSSKNIKFTTQLIEGIQQCNVIFFALPTPPNEDGSADLKHVMAVAETIAPNINDYKVIVNKSTVPVGTCDKVQGIFDSLSPHKVDIVSNPEFLKEGVAVRDFLYPSRIVIGTQSEQARSIMHEVYAPLIQKGAKCIFMDERSSELTKYTANSFLAMKITFMNEIANICEKFGADIEAVKAGIGDDDRIGNKFLNAGIGYGGFCFPKDVKALIHSAETVGYDLKVLKLVDTINKGQIYTLLNKIEKHFNYQLSGKKIAIWGLSFKPDTDDIREAPALGIIAYLLKNYNLDLHVYDPESTHNVKEIYGNQLLYGEDKYACIQEADALIICTEWKEFKEVDWTIAAKMMKSPVIFDGRNMFPLRTFDQDIFTYYSIGRKDIKA